MLMLVHLLGLEYVSIVTFVAAASVPAGCPVPADATASDVPGVGPSPADASSSYAPGSDPAYPAPASAAAYNDIRAGRAPAPAAAAASSAPGASTAPIGWYGGGPVRAPTDTAAPEQGPASAAYSVSATPATAVSHDFHARKLSRLFDLNGASGDTLYWAWYNEMVSKLSKLPQSSSEYIKKIIWHTVYIGEKLNIHLVKI